MTFYELMMCVLLEIKICSYKGPNTFHATQQEISNKNSSFFDIYSAVEELNDNEFVRTEQMDESIALFLDEMKNSCNNDFEILSISCGHLFSIEYKL